jgi:hypothetical protein
VSRGQRGESLRPYSWFSRPQQLLFLSNYIDRATAVCRRSWCQLLFKGLSRGQLGESLRPYSRFSRPQQLLFLSDYTHRATAVCRRRSWCQLLFEGLSRGQRGESLRPYSRFSRQQTLLFLSSSCSIVLMKLSGSQKRSSTPTPKPLLKVKWRNSEMSEPFFEWPPTVCRRSSATYCRRSELQSQQNCFARIQHKLKITHIESHLQASLRHIKCFRIAVGHSSGERSGSPRVRHRALKVHRSIQ